MIYKIILTTLLIGLSTYGNAHQKENTIKINNSDIVQLPIKVSPKQDSISFVSKAYTAKAKNSDNDETIATIKVAVAQGNTNVIQSINDTIYKNIQRIMPSENSTDITYQEMANNFVTDYEEIQKEEEGASFSGWFSDLSVDVTYNSTTIINMTLDYTDYMGGAHPNGFLRSLLFDTQSGKKLEIDNLISNMDKFKQIAENEFRKTFDIGKEESLNSHDFWFDNDKFSLPQNIFVENDGLQLVYNRYEISSYARGYIYVSIPFHLIKDLLKINIK